MYSNLARIRGLPQLGGPAKKDYSTLVYIQASSPLWGKHGNAYGSVLTRGETASGRRLSMFTSANLG